MRIPLRIGKQTAVKVESARLSNSFFHQKIRTAILAILIGFPTSVPAIVFPLETERYDDRKNLIDYSYAHARGQEIGYYTNQVEGYTFLGTAIAPNWFLTANHTTLFGGVHTFYDYRGKAYDVIKVVPNLNLGGGGPDMALVQVAQTFPYYSRIAKTGASINQQGKVYGLGPSSWAHGAIHGPTGRVQARYPVGTGPERLRWGLAKFNSAIFGIYWPFTASDPDLGSNCAGIVTGDSGGPIFLRQNGADRNILLGITTTGFMAKNVNTNANSSSNCVMALVWNTNGIYGCPSGGFTWASGGGGAQDVGWHSAKIYGIISPPIRLAMTAAATNWTEHTIGTVGTKATNYSTTSTIDTNGVNNPAPQAVYQNLRMIPYAQPRSEMRFIGNNLLRNETYKVRIHFSSIEIAGLDYSKVVETIRVIDANGGHTVQNVKPYASGLSKGTVMDFPGSLVPNSANQIIVGIIPSNSAGTFAVVSGVEIVLNW